MSDKKPRINSAGERELDKAQEQFDAFDQSVKEMTLDRMNATPKLECEPQTQISQKEMDKKKDIYLKPKTSIGSGQKFNEDFRKQYEYDKEYVHFTAENKEIIGESLDIWTRPYGGMAAEEWIVPVNTPVWGPRYLAEQIKRKVYHRLVMHDRPTGGDGNMQFYGTMAVDTTIQRLDAHPVSQKRSVFMGSNSF